MRPHNNLEQVFQPESLEKGNYKNLQQMARETKSNKMQKLRQEIEFLERGMQRVKTRLSKIQQDLLLTPTMSLTGIRPKQLTRSDYDNYPEDDHYPEYIIQEHDIKTEQHDIIERQIRTDTSPLKQLQEEDRNLAIKQQLSDRT